MTDCNRDTFAFSRLGPQTVTADLRGGQLTTDAGAVLLREVDHRIGLIAAIDRCLPDPRRPELITHDQKTLLAQRIFGIASGYEDLNDHQTLRRDPTFQVLAERTPDPDDPLGSPSTLCRLENRVDRTALVQVAGVLVDPFVAAHAEPPEA